MKIISLTILACLLAIFTINVSAQNNGDVTVFVAPTDDGFGNFISAAFLDNKLPFKITMDESVANYIVVCSGVKGQNKWYDTVFGAERDRSQGSMKLVRVRDRAVVWAGAAGDRSLWFNGLKSGGQKKVANRLARKLKDDLLGLILENTTSTQPTITRSTNSSVVLSSESFKISQTKSSADRLNTTGTELFGQRKFAEAEEAFREAIKLDPYNAAYHHNLGCVLGSLGKFNEAENEIELATRLAPNDETFKKSLEAMRINKQKH